MKRTTVKLPDELDARLRQEAKRRGMTVSELTRTAIEEHVGSGRRRKLGAAAAGRSGRSDVSERIEEIIASEVAESR
jgi:predicted transcriptional regulator